jgi:hypothetical protein
MKRRALALTLLLALSFSAMAGAQISILAKASSPVSSGIAIISPENMTYRTEPLILKIMMVSLGAGNSEISVTYSLDEKANVTVPLVFQGQDQSFQVTITGSVGLPTLSEGSHSVTVYSAYTLYNFTAMGTFYPKYVVWDHNTVFFTIDYGISPAITTLSLENKTYNDNNLLLNFTTDEPTSWMGYCLDQQANVTSAENVTLTGLAEGSHSIVVYANDTAGNMSASETIIFTVDVPEPFSIVPVAAASIATVAVVGVGLLVYFKKRKHNAEMAGSK